MLCLTFWEIQDNENLSNWPPLGVVMYGNLCGLHQAPQAETANWKMKTTESLKGAPSKALHNVSTTKRSKELNKPEAWTRI